MSNLTQRPLAGRTALVTGASRGIGRAIAVCLAQNGANVAVLAKTLHPHPKLPGTIGETAELIIEAGGQALPFAGDIRDEAAVDNAVAATAHQFGGLDIVVNNASAIDLKPTGELSLKRFDLLHQVNARGTFATISAALPYLRNSPHAHVVTLSPALSTNPQWLDFSAYTVSKYAMTLLTLGVARTEAKNEVAANCLWPATTISTAAVAKIGGDEMIEHSRTPAIVADAALAIVRRDPTVFTGNTLSDEEMLAEEGITDLSQYATVKGQSRFQQDFFLD